MLGNRTREDGLGHLFSPRLLGDSQQYGCANSAAMGRTGSLPLHAFYPLPIVCAHSLRADALQRSVRDTLGFGHGWRS